MSVDPDDTPLGDPLATAAEMEVDADAVVLRATVLADRSAEALRQRADETVASVAARASGYLAPDVVLGGAVVAAGVIETDALDRGDVATYLGELAESHPGLMGHVASGGGPLLDGLRLRSLVTASFLSGAAGPAAANAGMRALGSPAFDPSFGAALRDVCDEAVAGVAPPGRTEHREPARSLADLVRRLVTVGTGVRVERAAPGRFVAYLPGPHPGRRRRLRLLGGDRTAYAEEIVRTLEAAVAGEEDPHVLLVGCGPGGMTATELAVAPRTGAFTIDEVVTVGAPAAQLAAIPDGTRVLSLEDRSDPVVLLGSLLNTGVRGRLTVAVTGQAPEGEDPRLATAYAADRCADPRLRAAVDRLRERGYLAR
ncbi:hypothetical protein [Nocardioides dongkuii]|uniref:hypothetical protein n=1 Tax=Nocardioides dongkuii TaxID=2760089 RepID=UPI0015F8A379|nr:hypothetical protein [Nocardioides dongkuii]